MMWTGPILSGHGHDGGPAFHKGASMHHLMRNLRLWPRTLFARLMVILLVGLALAHAASFGLVVMERKAAADTLMLDNLERDVAGAVAILDRLPARERPAWLERLRRDNYSYRLDSGPPGGPLRSPMSQHAVAAIEQALQERYAPQGSALPGQREHFQVSLRLSDGAPLTIDVLPVRTALSPWLPVVLCAQLALLAGCAWLAVRLATRALDRLADAADRLGPEWRAEPIAERGPAEVVRAATAFNAMQQRIAGYLAERIQILAAISHDLQTPITRMRLGLELMEDSDARTRLQDNLLAMERLVREGIAYARTPHGGTEAPRQVDADALLESLASGYRDAGRTVAIEGRVGVRILTRPQALRRVLGQLLDNAFQFGSEVTLAARTTPDGGFGFAVLDRGPGIPAAELEKVMAPFYRLEASRNRGTGGTGLGLAIATQLARALGGRLVLRNRDGGGLQAEVTLPARPPSRHQEEAMMEPWREEP